MATFRRLQNLFRARRGRLTGADGERRAERFLRGRGYAVVARNWRNPRDRREEVDLVCRDGGVLVFVEVKTRSARARVPGYYAVTERKRRILRRVIGAYLGGLHPAPRTFRFDVVEVGWRPEGPRILHFANVPLFGKYYRRA